MKKVLLTIALVAFAAAANAQIIVGGNLSVSHNGNHDDDYTLGSKASTSITVMPKIGYQMNDKMQVGAQLGINYYYNRAYVGTKDDQYTSEYGNVINFAPYFRYNVAKWNNFTVFCEIQGLLGIHGDGKMWNNVTEKESDNPTDPKYTKLRLDIVPGLNYSLNEKISLDIYCNLLGIYAEKIAYDKETSHDLGLRANATDQTITSHLSNFTIGFNYHL